MHQYLPVRILMPVILLLFLSSAVCAGNIDPTHNGSCYAWGENVGWINLAPAQGEGITVTDSALTGTAWGENVGWITFNPTSGGVVNDGAGNLSGTAWGENIGWINFRPQGGGVSISPSGVFSGRAWGENVGWISFGSSSPVPYQVSTTWLAPVDSIPATFDFAPVVGANRTTLTLSSVVTLRGFNVPLNITISGGEYAVNGGAFTASAGTVNSFDSVQVRLTSSGSFSTKVSAMVTVGGVSAPFEVTTLPDTPPLITQFVVPQRSFNLTVPITLTASDNSAVSGYYVAETSTVPGATGWQAQPPTSFVFNRMGSKTLYAWARDDGGNVSDMSSAPVLVTAPGPVARTGQTTCRDAADQEIACGSTGQDAEIRAGMAWTSPRFTLGTGNTTITDTLTGLVWLNRTETDAPAPLTWKGALDAVKALNQQQHLGYGDWRLPNINELKSLLNLQYDNQMTWWKSQGFGLYAFSSHEWWSPWFWSSSTSSANYGEAWAVSTEKGSIQPWSKGNSGRFLAVRGSSDGNLTLAQTGQTTCTQTALPYYSATCAGTGQDGDVQRGVSWPNPRFTDNGNQTVTDTLSGLIWAKNGNLAGVAKNWSDAVAYIASLNSSGYQGFQDWRLPNRNELESLVHWDRSDSADWLNVNGFSNVQRNVYWSSSVYRFGSNSFWGVQMEGGESQGLYVGNEKYVWPVRGGFRELVILTQASRVIIVRTGAGFDTVFDAHKAAQANDVLLFQGDTLACNSPIDKPLILRGGFDGNFSNQTGYTILQGNLTVGAGSAVIDRMIVK